MGTTPGTRPPGFKISWGSGVLALKCITHALAQKVVLLEYEVLVWVQHCHVSTSTLQCCFYTV
eukprot:4036934-Amphidinium_carterae.1